jgi:hypothetical protein
MGSRERLEAKARSKMAMKQPLKLLYLYSAMHLKSHIPPNYVVEDTTAHRKPPDVRI